MARTRTFIAIDLGATIRDNLVTLQETLARAETEVKWVEPENLHITLLFLGEVDNRELPAICKAVSTVCQDHESFSLGIETLGCFPNMRRPRVIWAGIGEGKEAVCALHDALEEPLLELGCYRRENRLYTPHLTLGRVKSDDQPADKLVASLAKREGWHGGQTLVREVLVMSSDYQTGHGAARGPTYVVLGRAKLTGAD